jgi:hypothetical protein
MPIFYGLYISEQKLATAFDLIRFFAEPRFLRNTHITVRGPYDKRIDGYLGKIGAKKSYEIIIQLVDHFFVGTQSTVFLRCKIPEIESVWNKPDYKGEITPHLTLYDGKDRNFAYSMFNLIKSYDIKITTTSTELREIESKTNPSKYLDVFLHEHHDLCGEILGRDLDYKKMHLIGTRQRLSYISETCRFIQNRFSDSAREQNTHPPRKGARTFE